ncbi:HSP90 family protein [Crossiella cryophila]|uniref:Molecular chaperone HtpG n=1 Tax=Crossiella cryophila TaxID=43355 RepID=A0A7W7C9Y6_9PSEU|nr:HSP90 family protein [Crossiella cryophila]MBB4677276.1 molecular chaperone HtpG [Crossiella cryophila]
MRAHLTHTFGVDLRGVIDLLSHHLYRSPRVYLRELLQNAVDAITARAALGHDFTPSVHLEPAVDGGVLRITDNGIGLTEQEVHSLLATLGRTSKRDELGFVRTGLLGQFGVGLLSCFMVARRIRVISRSARGGAQVVWTAEASGDYRVETVAEPTIGIGTVLELEPGPDAAHWLDGDLVRALAREFGELLPVPVTVAGAPGDGRISRPALPWTPMPGETATEHRERLLDYCGQTLGFTPFDVLPLDVPAAGLTGAAFVLPAGTHPGVRQAHRVYLRRMLVGDGVEGLLPEWAYFVRCVVNTTALRPTASREALYEDETLLAVREALGKQLRDWVIRLGATEPARAGALLSAHQLGIKAMALTDDDLFRLVERWLPFETTEGVVSLRQFRRKYGTVLFTPDVDEFRQLAAVAEAQGLGLVNAGYAYDTDLMRRLVETDGRVAARRVLPSELLASLGAPDPEVEQELLAAVDRADAVLARHDCEPVLCDFDPISLPALLITDPELSREAETEQLRAEADPLWADLLGQLSGTTSGATHRLVLNCRNPLVRRIGTVGEDLARLAIESLYVHALLQSRRPLRPKDTAALNRSFLDLLDRAVHSES